MLVYRSEATARHAYESLVKALEAGKLSPEVIFEAEARVKALKKDKQLKIALKITFIPTGGTAKTVTKTVTVKQPKKTKK